MLPTLEPSLMSRRSSLARVVFLSLQQSTSIKSRSLFQILYQLRGFLSKELHFIHFFFIFSIPLLLSIVLQLQILSQRLTSQTACSLILAVIIQLSESVLFTLQKIHNKILLSLKSCLHLKKNLIYRKFQDSIYYIGKTIKQCRRCRQLSIQLCAVPLGFVLSFTNSF